MGRFEVRLRRTGALEAAFAQFTDATAYAGELLAEFGEPCHIVDLYLDEGTDGIVWRDEPVEDETTEVPAETMAEVVSEKRT